MITFVGKAQYIKETKRIEALIMVKDELQLELDLSLPLTSIVASVFK